MPTYVLICKTCNIYKDFQVHAIELRNAPDGPIISKWCPMCLKTTEWIAAFQERRCGRDRRRGVERRIPV